MLMQYAYIILLLYLLLISELNKYGVCLEPTKKYNILDDIGKH